MKIKKEQIEIIEKSANQLWRQSQGLSVGGEVFQKMLFEATIETVLKILELKSKESCKHDPEITEAQLVNAIYSIMKGATGPNIFGAKCKHCGVELEATWSEKK